MRQVPSHYITRGVRMSKIQISDEARDFILQQTEIITVQMELCGG